MRKPTGKNNTGSGQQIVAMNYESHVHPLITISTLPAFCSMLSHIVLPCNANENNTTNTHDGDDNENDNEADDEALQNEESNDQGLPSNTDLHYFRDGIKPTWEDPANRGGGRFIVRVRKNLSARLFEWLLFSLLVKDDQHLGEQVCGAVLSSRYSEDLIAVWCSKLVSDNEFVANAMRERLRSVLQLPTSHPIDYKPHDQSMRK